MNSNVQKSIDRSSAVAAGMGVLLSPLPLADEALLLPILGALAVRIGHAHGLGWKELPWKPIAKTALGGLAARATVNFGVAYIPFVAAVANGASAAALVSAFGAYADRTSADPEHAHAETLHELKADVHDAADHWRRLCSERGFFQTPSTTSPPPPTNGESPMNKTAANAPAPQPEPALEPIPQAQEIRADIDHALHTRHFGHGKVLFKVEDGAKSAGTKVWELMKEHPYGGIAAVSAAGFVLAASAGVGELAVAGIFGYAAYKVLRRGEPVDAAVEEIVRDCVPMA
ncbi:MAG TPA: hypothetical protein VH044_20170 [Polyangiaceae bacterium]|jgi:uncharacterized protein (DUF697 family)|nr:hypothetical protein [Polyangiaceae bacterium]